MKKIIYFIFLIVVSIEILSAQENHRSLALFKLVPKNSVDSLTAYRFSNSLFKELASRSELILVDTYSNQEYLDSMFVGDTTHQSFDQLIHGFISDITSTYYLLHLKLINSESKEIIRSVNVEFNFLNKNIDDNIIREVVDRVLDFKGSIKKDIKVNISIHDNKYKKRNQIIRRVISGVATVGFGAAGIVANKKIKDTEQKYDNLVNGSQTYYNKLWNDIDSYSNQRNAFIGAAAGFSLVFLISIPF